MKLLNEYNLKKLFNDKTISLVCNGGSLKSGKYVDIIDNSDIVIRLNHGAINIDNLVVGKKIDIFATNSYNDNLHPMIIDYIKRLDKNVKVITTRPLQGGLKYGFFTVDKFIDTFNDIENDIIEIPKSIFLNNSINDYYNYSSGLSVLLFLNEFKFKELKIFGMDFFENGYYYNDNKNINGGHNSCIEKIIVNNIILSRDNIIKF